MGHQVGDGSHTGQEMAGGQHLGLIKDYHTVRHIVQLAALGGTVGIEGFKKLDGGCDNHRGIPVFRGKPLKEVT